MQWGVLVDIFLQSDEHGVLMCVYDSFVFLSLVQRKSRRYYPTRLAISLAAGVTANPSSSSSSSTALNPSPGTGDSGFIVVETNYRVYAYTSAYEVTVGKKITIIDLRFSLVS